jgi:hypothetical protein
MDFRRLLSRIILPAALISGVLAGTARAVIIYDGFDYPPGGEELAGKNGGTGWGGAWAHDCCAQALTTASGLSFGGLAVTPGAATTSVAPPVTVSRYLRAFGTSFGADNTTLFFSFLLRPDADFGFYGGINLGSAGGDFFVGKSGIIPGSQPEVPVFNYSLEGGGMIDQSDVAAVAGTTVLLVLRAQFHDGSDDVFDLYVNPTPGGALPAGSDAELALPNVDLDFLIMNNATGWTTDEIRLGATFAEVTPLASVPVPSPLFLMAGGLAGLATVRRRGARAA